MSSQFRPLARDFLILLTAATLTACGGGGGSNPPPSSGNPPAPAPNPPPPSSPGTVVPPVSATVQDLSDGHRIGVNRWASPQADGNPIGTFSCIVNQPQSGAFTAHLSILLNNEAQAIPTQLGAVPQPEGGHCFYTIHDHDGSGRIHVTPGAAGGTFTLGQLFQVWDQPLTNTNVAGITGLPIEIFVTDNGTVTKVEEADWTNIELKSHREITIGVGTSVAEIPNYTWTD
jgi:hypothetical protein